MTEKPLYPFGFGLSYTNFRFDSINLSINTLSAGGCVKAEVTVTNTGKRDAEEVVQLYISRDNREENEPFASLKGFRRVFIPAGRSKTVEFALFSTFFETINTKGESTLIPGSYTIFASDAAPVPVSVEKGAPE
ncbi:fibronectin type III-like domain-contianing protein, partial [Treponema sp. R80B11-R83G3]